MRVPTSSSPVAGRIDELDALDELEAAELEELDALGALSRSLPPKAPRPSSGTP